MSATAINPQPSQVRRPWRALARTAFQAFVGLAAIWALVVEAAGVDPSAPVIATSLAVTAGVTRVMALPGVERWLQQFLPFLAAEPKPKKQGGSTN